MQWQGGLSLLLQTLINYPLPVELTGDLLDLHPGVSREGRIGLGARERTRPVQRDGRWVCQNQSHHHRTNKHMHRGFQCASFSLISEIYRSHYLCILSVRNKSHSQACDGSHPENISNVLTFF